MIVNLIVDATNAEKHNRIKGILKTDQNPHDLDQHYHCKSNFEIQK